MKNSFFKIVFLFFIINLVSIPYYSVSAKVSDMLPNNANSVWEKTSENPYKNFGALQIAAQDGNIDAMFYLGVSYYEGNPEKNLDLAYEWLYKAANKWHSKASIAFNLMLSEGYVPKTESEKAILKYKLDADKGDINSIKEIANSYLVQGSDEDILIALDWYEKAAYLGDVKSAEKIANFSISHWYKIYNFERGFKWYTFVAQKSGDYNGLIELYHLYPKYQKDIEIHNKIIDLLKTGAKNGNSGAKYFTDYTILPEEKRQTTESTLINIIKNAANNTHELGSYVAVELYMNNKLEVEEDTIIAWLNSASRNMYNRVLFYKIGKAKFEELQDSMSSLIWLEEAAELRDEKAANLAGKIYLNGYNIEKDYEKAFYYFSIGANLCHADSLQQIGKMYSEGLYVKKDSDKAKEYKILAKFFEYKGEDMYKEIIRSEDLLKASNNGNEIATYALFGPKSGYDGISEAERKKELIIKAAKSGELVPALYEAAKYSYNDGYNEDPYNEEVLNYLKKAADKYYVSALDELGKYYFEKKEFETSYNYFYESSFLGSAKAMFNIGLFYENGYFVNKNIEEAKIWYASSYYSGNNFAYEKIDSIK